MRFVEADDQLWALKALPHRVALRRVRRPAHAWRTATCRRCGPPASSAPRVTDEAVLVTRFLDGSWQYRRLLLRVPISQRAAPRPTARRRRRPGRRTAPQRHPLGRRLAGQRAVQPGRPGDRGLAGGCGDRRDPPGLSDGQRQLDLDILTENLTGGLLDVAARRGELPAALDQIIAEVDGIAERYRQLWDAAPRRARRRPERRAARSKPGCGGSTSSASPLTRCASAVTTTRATTGRLSVCVAGRRFHCEQLPGPHRARRQRGAGHDPPQRPAGPPGRRAGSRTIPPPSGGGVTECSSPASSGPTRAVGHRGDPIQAYCDLLEVRWLLSEQAGADVGDGVALDALARAFGAGRFRRPPGLRRPPHRRDARTAHRRPHRRRKRLIGRRSDRTVRLDRAAHRDRPPMGERDRPNG